MVIVLNKVVIEGGINSCILIGDMDYNDWKLVVWDGWVESCVFRWEKV